jgi:type VI protein secretion system component VasF
MTEKDGAPQCEGPRAPQGALDKFQLREVEQRLAADLQAASEQLRRVLTEEQKQAALQSHSRALQRFTDFAAKQIVPEDLLPPGDTTDSGSKKV